MKQAKVKTQNSGIQQTNKNQTTNSVCRGRKRNIGRINHRKWWLPGRTYHTFSFWNGGETAYSQGLITGVNRSNSRAADS